MGCDTKGVVVTRFKDVFKACVLAENALNKFIDDERQQRFPGRAALTEAAEKQFSNVDISLARAEAGYVQMHFTFEGEFRTMSLFFQCDSDYKELGREKLIVSLGCFGRSEHAVKRVLHALSLVGPAHFVRNDCVGDFEPLNEYRPSLLQAVKLGYIRDCYFEDWLEPLTDLAPTVSQVDKSIGLTARRVRSLMAEADEDKRYEALKRLLVDVKAPPLQCVLDFEEEMAHREQAGEPATAGA